MAKAAEKTDPRVTKRKVTLQSATLAPDGNVYTTVMTDYVRPDFLDAYVADAQTRWQVVTVSDEPDAGPGGYHGETVVPENLTHELAGQVFPATKED
jgi:hypothetical protein